MDKKELLKRWALAYTEPSLFYVPFSKQKVTTYPVEFRRYANVKTSSSNGSSSGFYTYMIADEIYHPFASAMYQIYDKKGNYYDVNGNKHMSETITLHSNYINLPKGQYFYKEMRSLGGCRLNKEIIPFSVADNQNTIVIHHQANLLSINYDIELEQIDLSYDKNYYTKETEHNRWSKHLESYPATDWFTAERIIDMTNYLEPTNFSVPIIKIRNISNYNKNYSNLVSFGINFYDYGEDANEIDITTSTNCNADFILPRPIEPYERTYVEQITLCKSKIRNLYYDIKVNDTIYDNDKTSRIGSKDIVHICSIYNNYGTIYNTYLDMTLTWYSYPDGSVLDWKYEGYRAETKELFGMNGRIGNTELVGKNTVLFSREDITPYSKKTYTYVNPETGERTDTVEETPATSYATTLELENFNEITIFKPIFNGIANIDRQNIPDLYNIYLYKTKGSSISCYMYSGSVSLRESRSLENGNDIKNKDADSIFIGALISYEERQE